MTQLSAEEKIEAMFPAPQPLKFKAKAGHIHKNPKTTDIPTTLNNIKNNKITVVGGEQWWRDSTGAMPLAKPRILDIREQDLALINSKEECYLNRQQNKVVPKQQELIHIQNNYDPQQFINANSQIIE
jgi:hypothetical protein